MTTLWAWTIITDIPVKVFTDNILPFCEAKDVISLCCTNTFFAPIATDETFWKRKLAADYNFPVSRTAGTSGWKFIYQRLRNPRVFVWGCVTFSFSYVAMELICSSMRSLEPFREKGYGQLGLSLFPETTRGDVPFPVELRIPGVRVVSLAASQRSVDPISSLNKISLYLIVSIYLQGCSCAWL